MTGSHCRKYKIENRIGWRYFKQIWLHVTGCEISAHSEQTNIELDTVGFVAWFWAMLDISQRLTWSAGIYAKRDVAIASLFFAVFQATRAEWCAPSALQNIQDNMVATWFLSGNNANMRACILHNHQKWIIMYVVREVLRGLCNANSRPRCKIIFSIVL